MRQWLPSTCAGSDVAGDFTPDESRDEQVLRHFSLATDHWTDVPMSTVPAWPNKTGPARCC